jgi:hypothetical protein
MKKRAEEIQKTGEATAEQIKRTSEDFTRAASGFDVNGMSKAWKDGYVQGLEAFFASQEQTGLLVKETVKQGLSGPRQMLQAYEKWLEQIQDNAGVASPLVEWSRQFVRSFQGSADPLLKTSAESVERTFTYYENELARPSRKYALDFHKKIIDTVISV